MLEFIAEVLIEYLFYFPGGLIRWVYFKLICKPKKLSELMNDELYVNVILSVIFFIMIGLILKEIFG